MVVVGVVRRWLDAGSFLMRCGVMSRLLRASGLRVELKGFVGIDTKVQLKVPFRGYVYPCAVNVNGYFNVSLSS